jgi:hypothetical protein
MTTLEEIYARALNIAEDIAGGAVEFSEDAAEALFPHVYQNVLESWSQDARRLNKLRKTHAATFADGSADLPAGVIAEHLLSCDLYSPAGGVRYIFLEDFNSFRLSTALSDKFGHFAILENKIHAKSGAPLAPLDNVTLNFSAVTAPQVPDAVDGEFDLPAEFTDDVVIELARALRGEPPYARLGTKENKPEAPQN